MLFADKKVKKNVPLVKIPQHTVFDLDQMI